MNKEYLKDIRVGFADRGRAFCVCLNVMQLNVMQILFISVLLSFIILFFTNIALSQTVTAGSLQSVSAGANHTCGITTDSNKNVYCWGSNEFGRLGNGSAVDSSVPVKVKGGGQGGAFLNGVSQVAAGYYHTCAVTTGGELYCWKGSCIGCGSTPVRVLKGEQESSGTYLEDISQVSAGSQHTCAVTTGGELYCWGSNLYGQLGIGSKGSGGRPTRVLKGEQGSSGLYLEDISQVSAGYGHTCAITTGGEVYCWGWNNYGQLGIDSTENQSTPVRVLKGEQESTCLYLEDINQVSAGGNHSCAVTGGREVYCWGWNRVGQLGINSALNQSIPVRVLKGEQASSEIYLEDISQVSAGSQHTCAVTTGGELYCWGMNSQGQLGINSTLDQTTPVRVLKGAQTGNDTYLENISQVTIGFLSLCAVTTGGELYCWGSNFKGRLGDGTTTNRSVPAKIFDGSGSAPCQNACCAHWGYENVGEVCSAERMFDCYGAAGDYSVVCGKDIPSCYGDARYNQIGQFCTTGSGNCIAAGDYTCSGSSPDSSVVCGITNVAPSCCEDALFSRIGSACSKINGNCTATGTYVCSGTETGSSVRCNITNNGAACCADPNYMLLGTECYSGEGVCRSAGTYICGGSLTNSNIVCNAVPNLANAVLENTEALCTDGLDNDCDGLPDELDPDCDLCPLDNNKLFPGVCGCGIADIDKNRNGIIDCLDPKLPAAKINSIVTKETEPIKPRVDVVRRKVIVYMQRFNRAELQNLNIANKYARKKGRRNKKRGDKITFKYEVSMRLISANKITSKKNTNRTRKKVRSPISKHNKVVLKKQRRGVYEVKYRIKIYKNGKFLKNTEWSGTRRVAVPKRIVFPRRPNL
ncbi:MAG: hypothetical protein ACOX2O_05540 [Bdellovibrionota bacterium]|jgi:alpha-tubulin suppressor-like RCC1 family protein